MFTGNEAIQTRDITARQLYEKVIDGLCPYDRDGDPLLFTKDKASRMIEMSSYITNVKKTMRFEEVNYIPATITDFSLTDSISFTIARQINDNSKILSMVASKNSILCLELEVFDKLRIDFCRNAFYMKENIMADINDIMNRIFTQDAIEESVETHIQAQTVPPAAIPSPTEKHAPEGGDKNTAPQVTDKKYVSVKAEWFTGLATPREAIDALKAHNITHPAIIAKLLCIKGSRGFGLTPLGAELGGKDFDADQKKNYRDYTKGLLAQAAKEYIIDIK